MKIAIVCYPTFGGSGVLATELGKALADQGHEVHFITYAQPMRLDRFQDNIFTPRLGPLKLGTARLIAHCDIDQLPIVILR